MKIKRFNESFSNDFDKECEYIMSSIEDFCEIIEKDKYFFKPNLSAWDNYVDKPEDLFMYFQEDEERFCYIGYQVAFNLDIFKKLNTSMNNDNSNIEISDLYSDCNDLNSMLFFLEQQSKKDENIKIYICCHNDGPPLNIYYTLNIINIKEKFYED